MKHQHIAWVTLLKTIAIFAVVFGHMSSPLTPYIFSFHMPLFFFISGFFLKKSTVLVKEIWKDISRYMAIFFIFACVGLIVEYAKRSLLPSYSFITRTIDLRNELVGIFYYMDFSHMHQYGFVLWFLPALVIGRGLARGLSLLHNYLAFLLSVFILLFGVYAPLTLPFAFGPACIGTFWIFLGMKLFPFLKMLKPSLILFFMGLVGILILLRLPTHGLDIANRVMEKPAYSILYSSFFILCLISMIKTVSQFKIFHCLSSFGENTMLIFLLHPYTNNVAVIISGYILPNAWILSYGISIVGISVVLLLYERFLKHTDTFYSI